MRSYPVIFINGPPYCGKDTLADHIVRTTPGFKKIKFARILKDQTHALYGCPSDTPHDFFEEVKDKPNERFFGLSPRQAYINVSEVLLKPTHGTQIFGKMLVKQLETELGSARGYVISDSGFVDESLPLIERFGPDNCLLIRVVANKRGCSFLNDSRSYIDLPIDRITIQNNNTVESFLSDADQQLASRLQAVIGGA